MSSDATETVRKDSAYLNSRSLFVCDNNEVISVLGRCNTVYDCKDASDEVDCPNTTGKYSRETIVYTSLGNGLFKLL